MGYAVKLSSGEGPRKWVASYIGYNMSSYTLTRDYDFVLCFASGVAGYTPSCGINGDCQLIGGDTFFTTNSWHWIRQAPNGVKHDASVGYAANCKKGCVINMSTQMNPPNNTGFQLICCYIE